MIQLEALSGKAAGERFDARRFPVRVGRSPEADIRIEDAGVWDEHFQLDVSSKDGFVLYASSKALVTVNGHVVDSAVLRNGDQIEAGAVKLRFWLGAARQKGLRFRESLFWGLLAGVCLGQIGLIYWMLQ